MTIPLIALTLLCGWSSQPTTDASTGGVERPVQVEDLSWLVGHWSGRLGRGTFSAWYSEPSTGQLLSFSEFTVPSPGGPKVLTHEFERFQQLPSGVRLCPYPKGAPADTLSLTKLDWKERKATFENKNKDFPTRIVYWRKTETRLVISLDDPHGDSKKVQKFVLDLVGPR